MCQIYLRTKVKLVWYQISDRKEKKVIVKMIAELWTRVAYEKEMHLKKKKNTLKGEASSDILCILKLKDN